MRLSDVNWWFSKVYQKIKKGFLDLPIIEIEICIFVYKIIKDKIACIYIYIYISIKGYICAINIKDEDYWNIKLGEK